MKLVEGSTIIINLRCGCIEKRITVIQGDQKIICPECRAQTDINFKKLSDGSYKMTIY